MKRSIAGLIIAFVLTIFVAALATAAPPAAQLSRIGLLTFGAAPTLRDIFRQSLRDLGYVEGQNLAVEERDAEGKNELLPDRAAELVAREVEVIVAAGYPAVRAAQQATRTIP